MKNKEWVVNLQIRYDDEKPTRLRYGVSAISPEIALAKAGCRVGRSFRGAEIVSAVVKLNAKENVRTIDMKR